MGLGSPVDVAEQTARPDAGQPGPGVDGDLAQTGQVEGEAALGDGRPGDVVAATLDPEEQALVAGEVDGGSHVGGRGRLEDERRGGRGQAVPDPDGLVPAWVTARSSRPSTRPARSASAQAGTATGAPDRPLSSTVAAVTGRPRPRSRRRSWRPQMRLAGTGMRSRSAAGMAGRAKAGTRPAMAASMAGVVARSRA